MKKLCCTLILMCFMGSTFAQLNSYKYIIVPKKFDIFPEFNHYHTSTLVKQLFNEQGYNVVYDDELPADLVDQRCLGVSVDLERNVNLTWTKMTLLLKDCNSAIVFRSPEGASKSKDFREAYHECIREAFVVFGEMNYAYQPPEKEVVTASYEGDVRSVQDAEKSQAVKDATVVQVATPEEQYYKDVQPKPSDYSKDEVNSISRVESVTVDPNRQVWMAKELPNGYELLNSSSEVKVMLYKTSAHDVFLAKYGNVDGMVYKKDSKWFLEYYEDSELVVEELFIDFQ